MAPSNVRSVIERNKLNGSIFLFSYYGMYPPILFSVLFSPSDSFTFLNGNYHRLCIKIYKTTIPVTHMCWINTYNSTKIFI